MSAATPPPVPGRAAAHSFAPPGALIDAADAHRGRMDSRILVPVRYSAWLSGDLGKQLEKNLRHGLGGVPHLRVTRMPRGFLLEADEEPGPFLEAVHHAMTDLEAGIEEAFPVFHHEMGPVWTGTLQVVFAQT